MKSIFLGIFLIAVLPVSGQLAKVYMPPPDHIGTAVCTVNDYPYKYPIASLREPVFISFDDLEGDQKTYYYRIRRFDENWEPSGILSSEYIDGYDTDYIQGEENSTATLQGYTHYFFKLPNENTRITKSGNYLVEILDEDEEPVFNFPLIIYEETITVSTAVQRANEPSKLGTHQYVHAVLNTGNFPLTDPSTELTVKIFRNENLFESKTFHAPAFNLGNRLDYHYPTEALFPGGDEFLHFETRDLRGYNPGVDSMRLHERYHAYLTPFVPGSFYDEQKDINGSFVVASFQAGEPETESDYIRVHFRLPAAIIPPGKDIYVVGRFNHWQTGEKNRLKPSDDGRFYETVILLKQGYYDYYFVGKHKNGNIDWTAVWPSFSQTENRYTVVVYYHPAGARYTRVIGMGQGISKPLR